MNDDIVSCQQMISAAFETSTNRSMNLINVWKSVVSKVYSNSYNKNNCESDNGIGERLAGNTRVIDLKNGVLLIETDHSGWIQYLKMYQKFILTGLNKALPDLNIKSMAFRVSGSKVQLHDSYEQLLQKEQQKMNDSIEKQESVLNEKYNNKNVEKKELPPELLEKFESIKKSMLTNSDK